MAYAKGVHPPPAFFLLRLRRAGIEADGVLQPAGHNLYGRYVLAVAAMHLGRHVADVALYLPDALAGTPPVAEEGDVAGIALRVVGTHQREEG